MSERERLLADIARVQAQNASFQERVREEQDRLAALDRQIAALQDESAQVATAIASAPPVKKRRWFLGISIPF